jgi:nucleoside-diphosphate-sugar epimerase
MGDRLMKVFVTGGSGFIGAHVMRSLLSQGHSVMMLAMPGDTSWRLQEQAGKFAVTVGVLSETKTWRAALNDFRAEACIHLAWYTEPHAYLDSPENISSLMATLSLLKELFDAGCRRVVAAGTCAEYDTDFGFLREDTPARPKTLYGAAKLSCGLLAQQLAAQAGATLAWARVFYPYGPQEDGRRLVPAAIRALLRHERFQATAGSQVRDYIYVKDIAEALCILLNERSDGVFNISSGVPVTIRQVLQTIGRLTGSPDGIEFGAKPCRRWEPPFICGDNRKLQTLGWQPRHTLEQGLSETIEWWKGHDRSH